MVEPRILNADIVDVEFGLNVTVVKPVNLYGCRIGANTFVGPFVEIQRGVTIGRDCRIQSHAFVCEEVQIGDDCFIAHGVMFINDPFKDGERARGDRRRYGRTVVEDHVIIGSNASILPVRLVSGVCVGAGAVVTRDLLVPGIYAGNPARLVRRR
jgi:acetyltransferase-like isoleucine patch superfamily enzyme